MATALVATACGGSGGAGSDLVDVGAGLKGRAGLHAAVYAKGLANASALALDPQGRLWVATADYDAGNDEVYVVDSAGAAPKQVLSGLDSPLGLLWHDGALYVASIAGVDRYDGFDGAAFARHRSLLALPEGVGLPGGLVLGPDGRMRLGISAPCDSCEPEQDWSAAVLSFLPDGADVRVEATGIRAPVGLAYYPGTADLFVTMNQRDDLGDATPGDWLSIVKPEQDWGFPDCYGQCSSTPQPTAVLDKHAAVSGVAIVNGAAIVAEWAVGRVQRVALTKTADGYAATVTPFLTGVKQPVPVLAGPNGDVFVGDWATGTIYRVSSA